MRTLSAIAACLVALALSAPAAASDTFAGDGKVFSGIASNDGQGLFVPQTLLTGRIDSFDLAFESEFAGHMAVVTNIAGGELASGLGAFPGAADEGFNLQTRLAIEPLWGLTPYVGLGLTQTPNDSNVFQGIPNLLPYEGSTVGIQGVAGIAYELMPGLGAGIEYSYRGYMPTTPVPGDASDSQTIMMRLDLGLN